MSRVRLAVNNELAPLYRMELIREGARAIDTLEIDTPEPADIKENDKVELIQDVSDISRLVMGLTFQKHLRDESGFGHDVVGSKPYSRELSSWNLQDSLSDYGRLAQNLIMISGDQSFVTVDGSTGIDFNGTRILGLQGSSAYELDLKSRFSFSFRANRNGSFTGVVFSKKETSAESDIGYLCKFEGGKIIILLSDGLKKFEKEWSVAAVVEDTWATFTLINDGSGSTEGLKLYINTIEQNGTASADSDLTSLGNSNEFRLGADGSGSDILTNTRLQNFKFWNRALTEDEITAVTLEDVVSYEDGANGYALRVKRDGYVGSGTGSNSYYPLNGLRLKTLGKLQGLNKRSFEILAWIKSEFGSGVEKQVITSSKEYKVFDILYDNDFENGWSTQTASAEFNVVDGILRLYTLQIDIKKLTYFKTYVIGGNFSLKLQYSKSGYSYGLLFRFTTDTGETLPYTHENGVVTVTGNAQTVQIRIRHFQKITSIFEISEIFVLRKNGTSVEADGWEWYIEQDANGNKTVKFAYKGSVIESAITDVGMLRLLWNRIDETKWKIKMFNDQTLLAESAEISYNPLEWGTSELIIGADRYGNNPLVGLLDGFRIYKDNNLQEDVSTLLTGGDKDIEWLVKRRQTRNLMTFGGVVRKKEVEQDNKKLYVKSHGKVLGESEVTVRNYTNKTFKELFIQIIKTNTNLTVNVEDIVDRTLRRYVSIGYLTDILSALTSVTNATFRTDALGHVFIEREGVHKTDIAFIHGENALIWKKVKDDSDLVNHVIVIGSIQKLKEKQLVETVVFNGYGRSKVKLNFTPSAIEVYTLDSDNNKNPLINGEQYIFNSDEREIEFIKLLQKTMPDNLIIEYTYDYVIQADIENLDSIEKYGRHSKRFLLSWLETREDVIRYANSYLEQHSDLRESVSLEIPDLYTAIKENDVIRVVNKDLKVNRDVVVKGLTWRYPQGKTIVDLGEYNFDTYDQEVQERLKIHELENLNVSKTSDVIEFVDHDIKFNIRMLAFKEVEMAYDQALGVQMEINGEELHIAYYNQATYGRRINNSYIYSGG